MRNRVVIALALAVLATCGRPDPVHRGDGGARPADEPDAGPEETGGSGGPTATGGSPTGGTTGTGGRDDPGTGGAGTGGMGTGGAGTGGRGTGGAGTGGMGTGGAGTGGMGTGGAGTGGAGTGGAGGGVGCSGAAEWRTGTYKGGDEVKHGSPAHRYRCKEYPFEGWCGIAAYEPGKGDYWMMAWEDLGACP